MANQIPLYGVVNLPEMEHVAVDVLRSGRIAGGEYVLQFEKGIGEIVGQQHVVSTNDMTSALFLALHLSGVGAGDEVLTTAFACLSTNSSIAQRGAVPVWVDVKPGTVEMDPDDLKSKIGPKTKAVILYHVAGYPGPAKAIADMCRDAGLALIEDCDNALLAYMDDLHVGAWADFSVYSFYPNRQINASEGGALVCKSAEMAVKARHLRRFGINFDTFRAPDGEISSASDIQDIGWGMTLNNLCAALGAAQLGSLDVRRQQTISNAAYLESELRGIDGIDVVPVAAGAKSAYWVFLVFVQNRDRVMQEMKKCGVMVSKVHQRNDIYSGFDAPRGGLPETDYLQDHVLGIPCGWWLSPEKMADIVKALKASIAIAAVDPS